MASEDENPTPEDEKPSPAATVSPSPGQSKKDGPGANSATRGAADYSAKDITVLEGLEHVRKRPGMYIGSTGITGLHHLVWEVVDNSVDEAMAGYASRIDVTLLADGGCRVSDDGRGIPVDPHPDPKMKGKSAAEIVLSVLNAGGKFGGEGYKVSGGLHGVGVSVVNALSARLTAEIDKAGNRHVVEFARGGKLTRKLEVVGRAPRGRTGTTITFWPDPTVFETTEFHAQTMSERFRMMAFLNAGLELRLCDEREGHEHEPISFKYANGLVDFVRHLNATKDPLFKDVIYYKVSDTEIGGEAEIAMQWNTGYNEGIHSFANGIATIEGGAHVEGFKAGLTTVINKYARAGKTPRLKEKDENLSGDDVREGLTAIVSVKLRDPQFEGQTKGKLGNTAMKTLVQKATNEKLAQEFEENPKIAEAVIKKALDAQRTRNAAKSARDAARRKSGLYGAGLPGKLKDCTGKDPVPSELFIVEGDSALGSAVNGRNPVTQAILPIRGKILNVERARIDKMMGNKEIQSLISAIGGNVGEDFDVSKARYHKIIALCDADVDGAHIRTLLLTFFFRQMRPLVDAGYVYIAQPPLYSTLVGKQKHYLKDNAARDAYIAENPTKKHEFSRLKGLGEMDFDELRDTTLDPGKRTLLQVTVEQAAIADEIMSVLMGDDVDSRKNFIVTNAREVRNLDF